MKKMYLLAFALLSNFWSAAAFSQQLNIYSDQWAPIYSIHQWGTNPPWHHQRLMSTDGIRITLDYQLGYAEYRGGGVDGFAHELWIHVDHPEFVGTEQIRVVLIAKNADYEGGTNEFVVSVDLQQSGPQSFSGMAARLYLGAGEIPFELATVVDGNWLVDPISGQSNFRPDLLDPVRR